MTDKPILNQLEECAAALLASAERERELREALREIAGARPRCCEITDAMQYIARTALTEKEKRND